MRNHIRTLRKEQGWTQADLAQLVHVSRQTIISLEKGSYVPSLELAMDLAAIFKLPIETIFEKEV
ncbi:helix-turn-helix transcriptional regulator [Enterococcus sp. 2201sp1_2201st1_B8_2201SCRN_220225]|uniref:helix-turn-helix transcriptional regulator n=1 Tax=unclassified Enterococcus TaxID=2608891 RepID=UPI0034A2D995